MKLKMKVLAAAAAFVVSQASFAGGGMGGGALEATQLLNKAELISIYASEAEQLAQQIKMLEDMVKNTGSLSVQNWASAENQLVNLVDNIIKVHGVVNATEDALSQMSAQFGSGEILGNYNQRLENWSNGLNNQIGAALQSIGMNINQFQSRQQALWEIQKTSQSAVGRMQVLQAGNQIAGLMVNEIQSLHGTIAASQQAMVNAVAIDANKKYQEERKLKGWMAAPKSHGW